MKRRTPPTLDELQLYADAALAEVPAVPREQTTGIAILIEEFPDPETVQEMGLESPFDLLGLYSGVPLDHKSVGDIPHDQDRIFLYRQPILAFWCESGEDLQHLVRHVLIHEIGHHFGLSDADMEALEDEPDAEDG